MPDPDLYDEEQDGDKPAVALVRLKDMEEVYTAFPEMRDIPYTVYEDEVEGKCEACFKPVMIPPVVARKLGDGMSVLCMLCGALMTMLAKHQSGQQLPIKRLKNEDGTWVMPNQTE